MNKKTKKLKKKSRTHQLIYEDGLNLRNSMDINKPKSYTYRCRGELPTYEELDFMCPNRDDFAFFISSRGTHFLVARHTAKTFRHNKKRNRKFSEFYLVGFE